MRFQVQAHLYRSTHPLSGRVHRGSKLAHSDRDRKRIESQRGCKIDAVTQSVLESCISCAKLCPIHSRF